MLKKNPVILPYDDYVQSANTLFHFMNKLDYLKSILINRAIIPRYCMENIEYLNIHAGGTSFKEVAILQKCFCDIPLHKLTDNFELGGVGDAYKSLTEDEKLSLMKNNTHTDYYGKFSVAFSKGWGENNNLQPLHYISEKSQYVVEFIKLFESAFISDDTPDVYANDILNRLAYFKPLRGIMKRVVKRSNSEEISIEFYKNFHDEQEWRYVPNADILSELKVQRIIANPKILNLRGGIIDFNYNLRLTSTESTGLTMHAGYPRLEEGERLDITFLSEIEYMVYGQKISVHTANLISNAIIKQIEKSEDGSVKILYDDTDSQPIYISYSGFKTVGEAEQELKIIVEHKDKYTCALTLNEQIEKLNINYINLPIKST